MQPGGYWDCFATAARKHFGRADSVRQAMKEAKSTYEPVESMTLTQETAALHLFGFIDDNAFSTSSCDEPVTSDESDIKPSVSPRQAAECDIADTELLNLVRALSYIWFEVTD